MASVITLCLAPARTPGDLRPSKRILDKNHLRGDLYRGNYVRKDVIYNNVPGMAGAEECAEKLDAALHAYPGHKIVVDMHSMGFQGGYLWGRTYGLDSDIDPDDVLFVGTGNIERKYGGAANFPESGFAPDYGGNGIPDDTPYTWLDIAHQHELTCDFPSGEMNDTARINAYAGFLLHFDYSQVAVNDPRNIEYVEGNRHYILVPSWPLPMINKAFRSTADTADRDAELRPVVESAYDRPFEVPTPTVRRIVAGLGWDTSTKRLVSTSVPRWKPFG